MNVLPDHPLLREWVSKNREAARCLDPKERYLLGMPKKFLDAVVYDREFQALWPEEVMQEYRQVRDANNERYRQECIAEQAKRAEGEKQAEQQRKARLAELVAQRDLQNHMKMEYTRHTANRWFLAILFVLLVAGLFSHLSK